jgi:hypothetical protein
LPDTTRTDPYGRAFLDKSLELASFPREALPLPSVYEPTSYTTALAAYEWELTGPVSELQTGRTPSIDGAFGRALNAASLAQDHGEARRTLEAYAKFERDDRILRTDLGHADVTGAIGLDTNPASGLNIDFGAFDGALEQWIGLHETSLELAMDAGSDRLDFWLGAALVMAPLVAASTWLGVVPRLIEYRWGRQWRQ